MGIIELKDIYYRYPDGTAALQNIHLCIEEGKKVAFLGPNGSGKSTLFLVLNGIFKPYAGEYYFQGEKISNNNRIAHLVKYIGVVFQDPDVQLFASSVYQEISFGPKNMGLNDSEIKKRVEISMQKTDIAHLRDKPTHFLSYGEKKRVSIADIIAMEGSVIILDEPLAWVDMHHKKRIISILNDLSDNKKTVIISTHDPDLAYTWADYVYILKCGRILGHGTSDAIFSNEELILDAGLETPFLIEISRKLKLKKIPRSREELLLMIEQ